MHAFADRVAAASPDLEAAPTSKDDTAFWLYSSGSIGFPKGCVYLHRDMLVCTDLYARGVLNITERNRCFSGQALLRLRTGQRSVHLMVDLVQIQQFDR